MSPPPVTPSLRARALQALARREYTRSELRQKLANALRQQAQAQTDPQPLRDEGRSESNQTCPQALLDALLDDLQAQGLLSDARAAASRARQKAARWGDARIRRDLQAKGVDQAAIAAVLAEQDSEWARARAIWQARFGQQPLPDEAQARARLRARQARFMAARGFSPDIVRRLLQGRDEEA